jgi:hypothetical protein
MIRKKPPLQQAYECLNGGEQKPLLAGRQKITITTVSSIDSVPALDAALATSAAIEKGRVCWRLALHRLLLRNTHTQWKGRSRVSSSSFTLSLMNQDETTKKKD